NSKSFILAAQRMAKQHNLVANVPESGAQTTRRQLSLPKSLQHSSVEFQLADALDLREFATAGFQVISAINLIDRLPRPRQFLAQVSRLLAGGGQLILASPFTWLEQFTPSREWLSIKQVQSFLLPEFRLARQGELPFLIREHRRKYQLVVSLVFTFVRRP